MTQRARLPGHMLVEHRRRDACHQNVGREGPGREEGARSRATART